MGSIEKKIWGQKSHATVHLRQIFGFYRKNSSKNIFGCFLKPSWAEEKGLESSETGQRQQRVVELQKSNFEGPQL
jgi:hypothetical protein